MTCQYYKTCKSYSFENYTCRTSEESEEHCGICKTREAEEIKKAKRSANRNSKTPDLTLAIA